MTDIFHDWKRNRFVLAPKFAYDTADTNIEQMVILTNVAFWVGEMDNLISWCRENGCRIQGMTVEIPTEELLTVFCLRWG